MAEIKVVISGMTGKMGLETLAAVSRESDIELVGGSRRQEGGWPTIGTPYSTAVPISSDIDSILEQTKPDVMVDFTNAAVAMEAAALAAARKINIVMGASGFSEDQLKQLDVMANDNGVGIIVAPALGPAFGGILLDAFNWHYVFFMSAPVAVVGVYLAIIFMPGKGHKAPLPTFDWAGLVLIGLFIGTFLTGISNGQRDGWGAPVISVLFTVSAISLLAFIFWELSIKEPILHLRVFINKKFAASVCISMVLSIGLYGSTYVIPLFVQTVQGYSPTRSGLLMIPGGLLMMAMFPLAGRLSDMLPRYQMVLFGLFMFGFSSLLMMRAHTDTPFWVFATWIMVGRVGLASMMPSLTVSAVSTLKPELLSQGSGALNFSRNLGGAVGVNCLALTLDRRTAFFSDAFAGLQTPDNAATLQIMTQLSHLLGQLGWPFEMTPAGALYLVGRSVYSQANMMAFGDVFLLCAVIFFCAMIPALLLRDSRHKTKVWAKLRPRPG